MNAWVAFAIGLFVGVIVAARIAALMVAARHGDEAVECALCRQAIRREAAIEAVRAQAKIAAFHSPMRP